MMKFVIIKSNIEAFLILICFFQYTQQYDLRLVEQRGENISDPIFLQQEDFILKECVKTSCNNQFCTKGYKIKQTSPKSHTSIYYTNNITIPNFEKDAFFDFGLTSNVDDFGNKTYMSSSDLLYGQFTYFQIKDFRTNQINDACTIDSLKLTYYFSCSNYIQKANLTQDFRTIFKDFNIEAQTIIFRYQLNINACHPSCLTCVGQEANQCTSCDQGVNDYTEDSPGSCQCQNSNYFFLNGKCVPSCANGYIANGKSCFPMKGCQKADPLNNGKCLICEQQLYNNDGNCQVQSIVPPGYELKGRNFVLSALQYNVNHKIYFQAFNSYTFSNLEIKNKGLIIKNSLLLNENQSSITSCNGINLLGGFLTNISGTSIQLPIIIFSHSQIVVVFKLYMIDVDERLQDVIINLKYNDKIIGTYQMSNKRQTGYFCGFDQLDATDEVYIYFSKDEVFKEETAKELQIVNQSLNYKAKSLNNIYLGIRDLTIIGFECKNPQCIKCLDFGQKCNSCKQPFTLQQEIFNCVECDKLSGYYTSSDGKYCNKCDSSCLECSLGTKKNCTKCRDNMFLSPLNECFPCPNNCASCKEANKCDKCENNFYFDKYNNCVSCSGDNVFIRDTFYCDNCDSSCMRCKGKQPTDCTKCSDKKYFQNNLCIECNSSQGYVQVDQCIPCHQSCKSCDGAGPNKCKSCFEASYLTLANECKSCIQNCKSCIDASSCDFCYSPYTIHEISKQCVQCQQIAGFYQDVNFCRKCDSSCLECSLGTKQSCTKCRDKMYLSPLNECLPCPNNCASCKEANKCDKCENNFYFDKYNNCVSCSGDNVFIRDTFYCDNCDSSCMRCKGKQPTDCTKCSDKKYFQNNLCIECNSSQGYVQVDQCIPCHQSCKSCDGAGPNKCKSCFEANYLTLANECKSCISNCKSCIDGSSCDFCYSPYTIHEISKQCVQCQQIASFYKDVNFCRKCDSSCKECNGGTNKQCTECYQETYLYQSTCLACPSNCLDCSNSNSCNKCKDKYYVHEVTKLCVICESLKGHFKEGIYCKKCNVACKECFGPTDAECYTCNELYFRTEISQNRCQKCPNNFYLESTKQNCQNCNFQCIPCNKFKEMFYMIDIKKDREISKTYCLVCSCTKCNSNFLFFNQKQCTNSCEYIGQNYVADLNSNSCKCQRSFDFMIQNVNKNSFDCSQVYPLGFYCNSSLFCMKCSQNCNKCSENLQCLECVQGFYNWNGSCLEDCFSSLNLVFNKETRKCECKEGFSVQNLSNNNLKEENITCQKILQIERIQVYNYLMQSYDIQFSKDFSFDKKNLVRIQFNRQIRLEEFETFKLLIDPNNLTLGSEYYIISKQLDQQFIDIVVEQEQNRRAKQFQISISESTFNYYTTNTIIISNQISTTMESDINTLPITQTFQSVSQAFASDDNSKQSHAINFLKQFQVLCLFSNFMQVLPLLYLIRDSLPPKINFASLLGASLIFKKIPPPSSNYFTTKQIDINNYELSIQYLEYTLGTFGISKIQ